MCLITFILNTPVNKALSHLHWVQCCSVKWGQSSTSVNHQQCHRVRLANFDSKWIFMHFWNNELNFGHPFYGVIPGDDVIVVTVPVLKLTMLTVGVHIATGIALSAPSAVFRAWSGEARFPMPCETANSSRNALFITLQLGESECRLGELITWT